VSAHSETLDHSGDLHVRREQDETEPALVEVHAGAAAAFEPILLGDDGGSRRGLT